MSAFITTLKLLSNVPLDNTLNNTLTFPNKDAQETFFSNKAAHSFFNLSYQREQMYVRIDAVYDDIINCNYIMYKNQDFSSKWYYAFITRIEYKNDNTSYLYFEIDAYQTFMFDIQIKPCFVEREHVNDDAVGANLIDEGLGCGQYITNSSQFIDLNEWAVIIASTVDLEDPDFPALMGGYNKRLFSGCAYYGFSTDGDIMSLNITLENLAKAGKLESIVQAFMFPIALIPSGHPHFDRLDGIMTPRILYPNIPYVANLNGYVPKNNKLFTSPYKSCVVSATTGGSMELPYEYISGVDKQIAYGTMITPNGGVLIWARNFKGIENNFDYHITLSDFPSCTWLGNSYANWNAVQSIRSNYSLQNATVNHALGTAKNAVNNLATGNAVGAALGGVNSVVDYAQDVYSIVSHLQEEREIHSLVPMVAHGQTSCSPLISVDAYGIMMEDRSITADYAKSIDNFFSVFGYKVNKVKVPNITGRPSWNYVKCSNAVVTGKCPVPFIDKIRGMLNRGITFWHGDYVGDYSRDNSTGQTPPDPTYYYTLNVIGGTGAGSYKGLQEVSINADSSNFKNWSSNNGGAFQDANSPSTIFTMPFNNVTITANYDTPQPAENLADYALQFVGAIEWDNTVKLWQVWYYGTYTKAAWCTTFLTYCAYMIGKTSQVPKNAAVQALYDAMTKLGKTWTASVGGRLPKKGDICFFITKQSTTVLHHCGIITNMHSDGITFDYVSGNTGNPSGGPDGVFVKSSYIGKTTPSWVKYFGSVD